MYYTTKKFRKRDLIPYKRFFQPHGMCAHLCRETGIRKDKVYRFLAFGIITPETLRVIDDFIEAYNLENAAV